MKKNIVSNTHNIFLLVSILIPQVSFAAFERLKDLLRDFKSLLDLMIPIIFALALIFFFYGLAQFIRSVSDKTIQEGKNKMIWGIISLFVMISIWGIINFIQDSLDIRNGSGTTQRALCNPDPFSGNPCS